MREENVSQITTQSLKRVTREVTIFLALLASKNKKAP